MVFRKIKQIWAEKPYSQANWSCLRSEFSTPTDPKSGKSQFNWNGNWQAEKEAFLLKKTPSSDFEGKESINGT